MNLPGEEDPIEARRQESSRREARARERREQLSERVEELRERGDDLAAGRAAARTPDQRRAAREKAAHDAADAHEEAARAHELSARVHDQAEQLRRRTGRAAGSPTHSEAAAADRAQADEARRAAASDRTDPAE